MTVLLHSGSVARPFALVSAASLLLAAGCSAPPGVGDGVDGPPEFGAFQPPAAGVGGGPGVAAPPSASSPVVSAPGAVSAASGEQAGSSDLGLDPAPSGGQTQGAGGAAMIGSGQGAGGASFDPGAGGASLDPGAGAGGASLDPGDEIPSSEIPPGEPPPPVSPPPVSPPPVSPPPAAPTPVAPTAPSPDEVAQFFAQLPCGAKYTAMGDGSYSACVRLSDGGAACTKTSAEFTRVTFSDDTPVLDVAQVSGMGENAVGVVTVDGALYMGSDATALDATPLIPSGVVNISGGRNARVALVAQGAGFGILGWSNDGAPTGLALPAGEQPIQVSANYGLACALSTTGSVFCWQQGDNVSIQGVSGQSSPVPVDLGAPVRLVSAGQDTLCGVTFDDTLTCLGNLNASPYLPTQRVGGDIQLLTTSFPSVREVHAAFRQGTIVRSDGAAFFLPGVAAGEDNPGQPFTGATDVVASGGDRGTSCVVTSAGEVFCMFGDAGGPAQRATLGGAALVAQPAQCPF